MLLQHDPIAAAAYLLHCHNTLRVHHTCEAPDAWRQYDRTVLAMADSLPRQPDQFLNIGTMHKDVVESIVLSTRAIRGPMPVARAADPTFGHPPAAAAAAAAAPTLKSRKAKTHTAGAASPILLSKQPCINFNNGKPCRVSATGAACPFAHRCFQLGCGGDHTAINCSK